MSEADIGMWVAVIEREYRRMPGLQLTKPQVRRLWGLREPECELVLDRLVETGVLCITERGCYVLAERDGEDAASTSTLASHM